MPKAKAKPDPNLVDNGGVVGVPGTEKHSRTNPPSNPAKNKGGRPRKDAAAHHRKPIGAAERDPHKIRAQREAEYKKLPARLTGKEIKADAREARRKARYVEKGY